MGWEKEMRVVTMLRKAVTSLRHHAFLIIFIISPIISLHATDPFGQVAEAFKQLSEDIKKPDLKPGEILSIVKEKIKKIAENAQKLPDEMKKAVEDGKKEAQEAKEEQRVIEFIEEKFEIDRKQMEKNVDELTKIAALPQVLVLQKMKEIKEICEFIGNFHGIRFRIKAQLLRARKANRFRQVADSLKILAHKFDDSDIAEKIKRMADQVDGLIEELKKVILLTEEEAEEAEVVVIEMRKEKLEEYSEQFRQLAKNLRNIVTMLETKVMMHDQATQEIEGIADTIDGFNKVHLKITAKSISLRRQEEKFRRLRKEVTPLLRFDIPYLTKKLTLEGLGGKKLKLLQVAVYREDVRKGLLMALASIVDFYFYKSMTKARVNFVFEKILKDYEKLLSFLPEPPVEPEPVDEEIGEEKPEEEKERGPSLGRRFISKLLFWRKTPEQKKLQELLKYVKKEHAFVGINIFKHPELRTVVGYFLLQLVMKALEGSFKYFNREWKREFAGAFMIVVKDLLRGKKTKLEDVKQVLIKKGEAIPAIPVRWILRPLIRPGVTMDGKFLIFINLILSAVKTTAFFVGASPDMIIKDIREKHPRIGKAVGTIIRSSLFNIARKLLVFMLTMKYLDDEIARTWTKYLTKYRETFRDLLVEHKRALANGRPGVVKKPALSVAETEKRIKEFVARGHEVVTNTITSQVTGIKLLSWVKHMKLASLKAGLIVGGLFAIPSIIQLGIKLWQIKTGRALIERKPAQGAG
jgi:hypothetical protein